MTQIARITIHHKAREERKAVVGGRRIFKRGILVEIERKRAVFS
jgi:hypothetical protein